jgi:UDP-glucose:tetrahydrobiopterin glucosyltransferase
MRIALLAPLVSPIAPPFLGGAQALLYDLAAGLAARGHDISLYAADGSQITGVRVVPLGVDASTLTPAAFAAPSRIALPDEESGAENTEDDENGDSDVMAPDAALYRMTYAFLQAFRTLDAHAGEYDLLHAHAYDRPAFTYTNMQPRPVVHTLHMPAIDAGICDTLSLLRPASGGGNDDVRLVTVSRACAATYAPFCRIDAVVYNGVHVDEIPFGEAPSADGYLLYAGRMAPEKGVEDALEIAARAGKRLILAGGVYDRRYFDERIAPRLAAAGSGALYLDAVPRERLWELMAGAEAVLSPSHWEEPFSLAACEAQAAGAPVIAYARGGLREVVADGETGWLVALGDIDGAAEAVARLGNIERRACRERVQTWFSLTAMLDGYEAFYAKMLAAHGQPDEPISREIDYE